MLRTERPSGTFSPFSWHELNKSHVTGNAKLFVFNADRAHACTIIALAICKLAATAEFSSAAIAEFIIADDGLYIWRCEVVNSLRSSDEDNTNHTYIYDVSEYFILIGDHKMENGNAKKMD